MQLNRSHRNEEFVDLLIIYALISFQLITNVYVMHGLGYLLLFLLFGTVLTKMVPTIIGEVVGVVKKKCCRGEGRVKMYYKREGGVKGYGQWRKESME